MEIRYKIKFKPFYITLIIIVCSFGLSYGELASGARNLSLGSVESVVSATPNSLFNNPAGLSELDKYTLLFSYMPVYGIDELYNIRVSFVVPIKGLHLSGGVNNLVLKNIYTKIELLAGLSFYLNSNFSFGFALKYFINRLNKSEGESLSINDDIRKFSFNLGMLTSINKYLKFGVAGKNLNNPNLNFSGRVSSTDSGIREFIIGADIKFTDNFDVFLEEKFLRNNRYFCLGSEFRFYNVIAVRAGISEQTDITLGLGFNLPYFSFDFGLSSHSELGNQYQVDVMLWME